MNTRPEYPIWQTLALVACFSLCIGALSFVVLSGNLNASRPAPMLMAAE